MAHVLIVDILQSKSDTQLHELVRQQGYRTSIASNLKEALEFSKNDNVDVVLLNGFDLQGECAADLQRFNAFPSAPEVIILCGKGSAKEAEIAIKQGAWDYIVSESAQAVITPLMQAIGYREKKQPSHGQENPEEFELTGIVGNSPQLKACMATLMQAAQSDANVLITGETGTGKELFASAIHENSKHRQPNFVVVDCAALPETLVESTLFGHEKGAFTGATQKQYGLIKQADGGTLFLDEVGELPLSLQKSFLRVLEERTFRPIGSKSEVSSDFRLVAATNQDLDQMVKKGTFREDLLFRLRSFALELPPLRSRLEDIKPLVNYFISRRSASNPQLKKKISTDFLATLQKYPWPGNVRELFHAVDRSLAAAREHTTLYPYHLPTHIRIAIAQASFSQSRDRMTGMIEEEDRYDSPMMAYTINASQNLQQVREQVLSKTEEIYLKELLADTSGNIPEAMKISGLSRSRFYQLLKDHGIKPATIR